MIEQKILNKLLVQFLTIDIEYREYPKVCVNLQTDVR